jgi:hypothetical protein
MIVSSLPSLVCWELVGEASNTKLTSHDEGVVGKVDALASFRGEEEEGDELGLLLLLCESEGVDERDLSLGDRRRESQDEEGGG